jgi:20S proteasome alpha/beta subunit
MKEMGLQMLKTWVLLLCCNILYGARFSPSSGYLDQVEFVMKAASTQGGTLIAVKNKKYSVLSVWSPRLRKSGHSSNDFRVVNRNVHLLPNIITRDTDHNRHQDESDLNQNNKPNHYMSIGFVGLPTDCEHLRSSLFYDYLNGQYAYGKQFYRNPTRVANSIGSYIHDNTIPNLARPLCVRLCLQGYDKDKEVPMLHEVDCLGNVIPCKYACIGSRVFIHHSKDVFPLCCNHRAIIAGPLSRDIQEYIADHINTTGDMDAEQLMQFVRAGIEHCVASIRARVLDHDKITVAGQDPGGDKHALNLNMDEIGDVDMLRGLRLNADELQVSVCSPSGVGLLISRES